jgi:hypothetical protein
LLSWSEWTRQHFRSETGDVTYRAINAWSVLRADTHKDIFPKQHLQPLSADDLGEDNVGGGCRCDDGALVPEDCRLKWQDVGRVKMDADHIEANACEERQLDRALKMEKE